MRSKLAKSGALLIIIIALTSGTVAKCPSDTFNPGAWSGQSWLATSTGQKSSNSSAADTNNETAAEEPETASDEDEYIDSTFITAEELVEMLKSETKTLVAYVSISPLQGSSYIEDSINLSSDRFFQKDDSGNEILKSVSGMAGALGDAGITEEDGVVVYGDCFSCGDSTFVLWMMKYLGHQNVRILQGPATGLSMASTTTSKPAAIYLDDPAPELLADYDSIAAGEFVVVDVRTSDQFEIDHIDGAVNIDFNSLIEGDWIKDDSALAEIFVDLEGDSPIVVYSDNVREASIAWYALQHLGYDARIYRDY
jgi:thiosulfate/3-mercaptopyruvate sulfurtransferase